MSIVLKTFFPFFTILSFYTKHMFKFIYVNQVIHMVILVDNVDKLWITIWKILSRVDFLLYYIDCIRHHLI